MGVRYPLCIRALYPLCIRASYPLCIHARHPSSCSMPLAWVCISMHVLSQLILFFIALSIILTLSTDYEMLRILTVDNNTDKVRWWWLVEEWESVWSRQRVWWCCTRSLNVRYPGTSTFSFLCTIFSFRLWSKFEVFFRATAQVLRCCDKLWTFLNSWSHQLHATIMISRFQKSFIVFWWISAQHGAAFEAVEWNTLTCRHVISAHCILIVKLTVQRSHLYLHHHHVWKWWLSWPQTAS